MKKILVTGFAALSGLAIFSAAPRADAADYAPWFATNRAGGFVDLWPTRDYFGTMLGADLQFRVARSVYLDISATAAYLDFDTPFGRRGQAAYGNPTIGAHYAGEATRNFHFFVGGTASLPLLSDPDSDVAASAYGTAVIRGYYDADRLWPGRLAIRGMGGFEWQITRAFFFRGEARPVVYVSTNRRYETGFIGPYGGFAHSTELLVETAAEAEYRWSNGFGVGGRMQVVFLPTINGDAAQALIEPFLTLTPRTSGFYLRFGTPVALDETLGFGLDHNKLATLRLSLGGQW